VEVITKFIELRWCCRSSGVRGTSGKEVLVLDESPGSRGGCWLKAEALSPRWGEQAVKWNVVK